MLHHPIHIQVFSDIHIELWGRVPPIVPSTDYLFLAGNIGYVNTPLFNQFMDYCATNWEKVFYVLGPYELQAKKKNYHANMFEYEYFFQQSKYANIFLLTNSFVKLNDQVNVYGATLWTTPTTSTYTAKYTIDDYHKLTYYSQERHTILPIDNTFLTKLSTEQMDKLVAYISTNQIPTIFLTHFSPVSSVINPKLSIEYNHIMSQYCSWEDIFRNIIPFKLHRNITAWISGNIHNIGDNWHRGIKLISNQIGKPFQQVILKNTSNVSGKFTIGY